jgi:hypothetical protein
MIKEDIHSVGTDSPATIIAGIARVNSPFSCPIVVSIINAEAHDPNSSETIVQLFTFLLP